MGFGAFGVRLLDSELRDWLSPMPSLEALHQASRLCMRVEACAFGFGVGGLGVSCVHEGFGCWVQGYG